MNISEKAVSSGFWVCLSQLQSFCVRGPRALKIADVALAKSHVADCHASLLPFLHWVNHSFCP